MTSKKKKPPRAKRKAPKRQKAMGVAIDPKYKSKSLIDW